jgi:transposase
VGARLKTNLLGPHPIIRHFIERLNLHDIVRSAVGTGREPVIDHGEALAALVHNILDSPAPLYRIAAWAEPVAPQAFAFTSEQKASLNDDRIARMLDALVSERGRGIWFRLALRIIKQFKIATARMHHDTTTVTFHGQYRGSVAAPRITHGHNKDHRPDLKQLVFGLTVSADGAVPVHHQVLSGNRTDDTVHRANLEDLRHILGRGDFVYVADGKLASSSNLREIARHHGKFVTVLPRTRTEDKKFRQKLREKGVRWKRIGAISNKRRQGEPPDVFYSCSEGPQRSSDGWRIIWVRSSAKAEHDEELRQRRLDQARAELLLLSPRLNRRRLRSRYQIRQAVRDIIRRTEMESFLRVELQRQMREEVRRVKPGRPKPSDPVRIVRKPVWSLRLKVDDGALRAECRADGVFPLGTNMDKASKRQVLEIYKYQPYVEKRFSQLKKDLEVAPVYIKKPLRCAGLVHAYYVALAVAALIERAVRQGMAREKIEDLPLFPEGRPTATPTCPRILEAFRYVSWHEFRRGEEIVCFPIELSPLQKLLLRLLEVPRELYA